MSENSGLEAIRHYVAMRDAQPMKGLDDAIHCIHTGTEFAAELRLSDLRALLVPAQSAVKPLPWEEINRDRGDGGQDLVGWEADSGFGPFYEIEVGHSSFDVSYDCQKLGDFDDPDQAKKCAQDHFETRIRAALSEGMREEPWLVWSNEHEAWWRANSAGYTMDPRQAGLYSRKEALEISWSVRNGWKFTKTNRIPDEIAVPLSAIPEEHRPSLPSTNRLTTHQQEK